LIVILISLIIDGVFWYYFFSSKKYNSTFSDLATGLAVAVIILIGGSAITAWSERNDWRDAQQDSYAEFLFQSDELVEARAKHAEAKEVRDAAQSNLSVANERVHQNPVPVNLAARLRALDKFERAKAIFTSAATTANSALERYQAAEASVERVASNSVRPDFNQFRKALAENAAACASARSKFIQTARIRVRDPFDQPASR
jgi:hypothetical protein